MQKLVQITKSPDETIDIACKISSSIYNPSLIGLTGEIGSGKTVFTKGFAKGLGVIELINSPTFLGISESFTGRLPFIHMDFYKKVASKEMVEYYLKKRSIVLIEWVENFSLIFKEKLDLDICVYIEYLKDQEAVFLENERQITIEYR